MGSGADSRLPRDSSHIQSTCIYYTSPTRVFLFLCCRAVGRNQPTNKQARPLLLFVLLGRLELPVLAADRAPLLGLGREPLRDALQVKSVTTGTPHHGAVIAGILGFRGTPIKGVPADAAHVVPRVPGPRSECPPVLDLDLESPRPLAARDRPGIYSHIHPRPGHRPSPRGVRSPRRGTRDLRDERLPQVLRASGTCALRPLRPPMSRLLCPPPLALPEAPRPDSQPDSKSPRCHLQPSPKMVPKSLQTKTKKIPSVENARNGVEP